MRILAIETSCDETAAAVVEKIKGEQSVHVLSNTIASSSQMHAKTGGIIPEFASREQLKAIIPVIVESLIDSEEVNIKNWNEKFNMASKTLREKVDAIAVTYGPGLIGSLLVGVETVKTLSFSFGKPVIPVNHLLAHLFANFIDNESINFPFVGLIVSGGHTDLLLFRTLNNFEWLGGTRDDAAGEALDKIGRLLKLSYPAGPEIEMRASKISNPKLKFKSPLLNSNEFDFSFSGLKAEVARFVEKTKLTEELINEICFATQLAIVDVLVKKTLSAAKKHNAKTIILGGGVSANQALIKTMIGRAKELGIDVASPEKKYSTDNAAMIGAYALLNPEETSWHNLTANPELYFA